MPNFKNSPKVTLLQVDWALNYGPLPTKQRIGAKREPWIGKLVAIIGDGGYQMTIRILGYFSEQDPWLRLLVT